MPRYEPITEVCAITMARDILNSLEGLHAIGSVYNDLKLENILFDKNGETVLIDFGLCQKYSTQEELSSFRGNLMFASVEKLRFKKTTRKDDLVALGYLLIYLVSGETFPFLKEEGFTSKDYYGYA